MGSGQTGVVVVEIQRQPAGLQPFRNRNPERSEVGAGHVNRGGTAAGHRPGDNLRQTRRGATRPGWERSGSSQPITPQGLRD